MNNTTQYRISIGLFHCNRGNMTKITNMNHPKSRMFRKGWLDKKILKMNIFKVLMKIILVMSVTSMHLNSGRLTNKDHNYTVNTNMNYTKVGNSLYFPQEIVLSAGNKINIFQKVALVKIEKI